MNKKHLIAGLSGIVVLQLIVLALELGNAVYPLWIGKEINLKTAPVDPRSMFRGNYARLRYDISQIPGADINKDRLMRNGEIVYVQLKANQDGIYTYESVSLTKPEKGLFIRGRIQTHRTWGPQEEYHVNYGIEALFAPKQKALNIEKKLRKSGIAKVMIAANGKAALKGVVVKE